MYEPQMTLLRNGDMVPEVAIRSAELGLLSLLEDDPIAAYELHAVAHNPQHAIFPLAAQTLTDSNLISHVDGYGCGVMHGYTRSVIVSMTNPGEFDFTVRDPRQPSDAS